MLKLNNFEKFLFYNNEFWLFFDDSNADFQFHEKILSYVNIKTLFLIGFLHDFQWLIIG